MLPDKSSPVIRRDMAGTEAAHPEERITAALDYSKAESEWRKK
jgi:hypothetical protein